MSETTGKKSGWERGKIFMVRVFLFAVVTFIMAVLLWAVIPTINEYTLADGQTDWKAWDYRSGELLASWTVVLAVAFVLTGPAVVETFIELFGFQKWYGEARSKYGRKPQ